MASLNQPLERAKGMPAIEKMAAKSSFIAAFEYDPGNLTLTTHMMNGAIYQHKFFLPTEWELLKTSQNHGKHWSISIKGKKAVVRVKIARAPSAEARKGRRTRK